MKNAFLLLVCLLCHLSAISDTVIHDVGDKLVAEDGQIVVIPEYWNPYRHAKHRRPQHAQLWTGTRHGFRALQKSERFRIGTGDLNGVYFLRDTTARINVRGLQDRLAKTFTGGWDAEKRQQYINDLMQTRRVPFVKDLQSKHIGIFFDGTGSFAAQTHTNIYRDYNQYAGSRFYFPGVGNFEENNVYGIIAGATWADMRQQFIPAIEQAHRDIQAIAAARAGEPVLVDCFGMSRGAAQCIELARLLQEHPIAHVTVNFLALYEPVYSLGFLSPGQNSDMVESGNIHENWTRVHLPSNVTQAAVLYGRHEERTWFSAAFLAYDKSKTILDIGILSGAHGSICGPKVKSTFQRCLHVMARSWMAERACLAGVPRNDDDVLPAMLNDACTVAMSAYASVMNLGYDDFGAGAIQGRQGLNLQWLAYRILPWRWGGKAPLLNRYQRNFTQLASLEFSENICY